MGFGVGTAGRSEPIGAARAATPEVVPSTTASWRSPTVPAEPAAPPSSAAAGGAEVARPPLEDAGAVLAWKQRQLARDASQIAAVDPRVKASAEMQEAVERERGALVSDCWNAQAPQDLESGARVKVVAAVDALGHAGAWQVFEVPETRRPELVDCVSAVLSRKVLDVSAPGRAVKAATFINFP